ncbi:MAG: hypothetical protein Q3M30_17645 [Candidatus Electrothrix sp. Rat3]|nr:hypothetical protein [Candidatus Electrothrix rattekaaiensis]
MKDPIVDEIRQYRNEHSEKFGYDLDAICEEYKLHQQKVGVRLTRLSPKLLKKERIQNVSRNFQNISKSKINPW